MNKTLVLLLWILVQTPSWSQTEEKKLTCVSDCNTAGDEMKNTMMVHGMMDDENYVKSMANMPRVDFPLRIVLVNRPSHSSDEITKRNLNETIEILNDAFDEASIHFTLDRVDTLLLDVSIEDLSANYFKPYNKFSAQYDLKDTITLFLLDYNREFCEVTEHSIRCGRTGGFAYILSALTNNVVLSKFDIGDHKIIVHEFGHFFGLYHTFEEHQFGKGQIDGQNCDKTGDIICDTPADPGTLYEVYVNYSKCEMISNYDRDQDGYYHPLINNYMSYYKPCYLKTYAFTPIQLKLLEVSARSELRAHCSK